MVNYPLESSHAYESQLRLAVLYGERGKAISNSFLLACLKSDNSPYTLLALKPTPIALEELYLCH